MYNLKQIAPLSIVALALGVSGLYSQSAVAQTACCRINSSGTLIASESSPRCNSDSSHTRRISNGNYEVDFNVPFTDVRTLVKMITLDTQVGGSGAWMVGVSDRSGDISSVFVKVRNHDNKGTNSGFNLCLF